MIKEDVVKRRTKMMMAISNSNEAGFLAEKVVALGVNFDVITPNIFLDNIYLYSMNSFES